MKTSGSTAIGTAFGLVLMFALLAGAYFLFKYVVGVFATLDPQVETLAAIATVVALLCAVIIAEGLKARTQQEQSIAPTEKAKVYERLLALRRDQLKAPGNTDDPPADTELELALALHGGAKVISAYNEFRRSAKQDGMAGDAAAALLNKLVSAMRADLGRGGVIPGNADLLELLSGWRQKT
jgi:hypothetical protein